MGAEKTNEVESFLFDGEDVRVMMDGETTYFVGADVCRVLGLKNPSVVMKSLDEDERAKLNLGRQGDAHCVTEAGLYHLIFKSRKTAAVKFRKWVTHEVLPQLRKRGFYSVLNQHDLMTLPEWLISQKIDVREEKLKARRLLEAAWDSSKLMGYRGKALNSAGLMMFPKEVLQLAEGGECPLVIGDADNEAVRAVYEKMDTGVLYSIPQLADVMGISGSSAQVSQNVAKLMNKHLGVRWRDAVLRKRTVDRRVCYVLENRKAVS